MNEMTLQFTCPAYSVYEYVVTMEQSPDNIRYTLLVWAHGGYLLIKFQSGKETKSHCGADVKTFELKNCM